MNHLLPSRSLTVRPWKDTFPIGKYSSNHHFFRGELLNFGGVTIVGIDMAEMAEMLRWVLLADFKA